MAAVPPGVDVQPVGIEVADADVVLVDHARRTDPDFLEESLARFPFVGDNGIDHHPC